MFTDNGINVQGADNQLLDPGMLLQAKGNQRGFKRIHPIIYMSGNFTPPLGGLWEAAINSMKVSSSPVMQMTRLWYKE
jgi:hypothetical protein